VIDEAYGTQHRLLAMRAEEHGFGFADLRIISILVGLTEHGTSTLLKAIYR
jgi:hypothetical protein